MLGRVMDFQFFGDPAGFRGWKCFIQRGKSMGIQVVHDKYNPVTVRIADIHQIPDLLRPVNRSAVFPDVDVPYTAQRFHEYKYAAGTAAQILGINFPGIPRAHGQRLPGLPQQLVWLFVHTYHWDSRVIRLFVDVQDILHTGYEFCVFFWRDAPVGVFVRSKFIFFNVWRMASLPTGISSSIRAFSSKSRIVQRECPSGAGLQAIWMICASARPSTFRSAALELGLIL